MNILDKICCKKGCKSFNDVNDVRVYLKQRNMVNIDVYVNATKI